MFILPLHYTALHWPVTQKPSGPAEMLVRRLPDYDNKTIKGGVTSTTWGA